MQHVIVKVDGERACCSLVERSSTCVMRRARDRLLVLLLGWVGLVIDRQSALVQSQSQSRQ